MKEGCKIEYEFINGFKIFKLDYPGFKGRYGITRFGLVWSYYKGGFMYPTKRPDGYYGYRLKCDGYRCGKHILQHRLVALTFLPNPKSLSQVNHKNLNRADCRTCNLEWITCIDNNRHALKYGNTKKKQQDSAREIAWLKNQVIVDVYVGGLVIRCNSFIEASELTGFKRNYISRITSGVRRNVYKDGIDFIRITHIV